jgi:NAD(P)-dependent dehydrogenase (short-subunit alcohol dehydrogenase family)
MTITRKVAVVTGAAQGFGQSISIGLAKRGIDIVAVDLSASDETVRAIEEAGARCVGLIADVSDPDTTGRLEALLRKDFGRCDILVNNAGIYPNVPITQVDYALWQRVQRINLDSQFLMVKAVLPLMMERKWGRIVNITSNSVALVVPGLSHYMASKAGVIGFTRGNRRRRIRHYGECSRSNRIANNGREGAYQAGAHRGISANSGDQASRHGRRHRRYGALSRRRRERFCDRSNDYGRRWTGSALSM